MRRIPDIIIAVGVIVGAIGIATGYRWVGVISLAIALIVGWKRDWCIESFEGMISPARAAASTRFTILVTPDTAGTPTKDIDL